MVRLLLAGAAFAALIAGRAMAADLAVRSYAVPAPPVGWSGLYVGANAGGTWGNANNLTMTTNPQTNFGGAAAIADANASAAAARRATTGSSAPSSSVPRPTSRGSSVAAAAPTGRPGRRWSVRPPTRRAQ